MTRQPLAIEGSEPMTEDDYELKWFYDSCGEPRSIGEIHAMTAIQRAADARYLAFLEKQDDEEWVEYDRVFGPPASH